MAAMHISDNALLTQHSCDYSVRNLKGTVWLRAITQYIFSEHARSVDELKELDLCAEKERKLFTEALCDLSIVGMAYVLHYLDCAC